ncbi:hypothetical protein [Bradyrhizobium aeschynomenes]|uniref:hypothetical protein n=1 Tax=Bradyrhizobium aeschynomenes TaxID=2734909 RepID=UPI001FED9225|nr:hypothetical protein [Bradyrhizobium aeschynomenes]
MISPAVAAKPASSASSFIRSEGLQETAAARPATSCSKPHGATEVVYRLMVVPERIFDARTMRALERPRIRPATLM